MNAGHFLKAAGHMENLKLDFIFTKVKSNVL